MPYHLSNFLSLLSLDSAYPYAFHLFFRLSCNSVPCSGCPALYGVKPN